MTEQARPSEEHITGSWLITVLSASVDNFLRVRTDKTETGYVWRLQVAPTRSARDNITVHGKTLMEALESAYIKIMERRKRK